MVQQLTVTAAQAGQRLDLLVAGKLPHASRAAVQRTIRAGRITVNDVAVKPRYLVRTGDRVTVDLPEEPAAVQIPPPVSLPIIYEDQHCVVINKPAGVLVHPAAAAAPAVTSWLTTRYPHLSGDPARPGVVHRLDQDTSGVLLLAKTSGAHEHFARQFKRHYANKEYQALVFGVPGGMEGRITKPLARSRRNPARRTVDSSGQPAITQWRRQEVFGQKFALLTVFPYTGRTHQIRVHLHALGHPVVGDSLYTFKRQKPPPGITRQLLHAAALTVTLPNGEKKTFRAPLPPDFVQVLNGLRGIRHQA